MIRARTLRTCNSNVIALHAPQPRRNFSSAPSARPERVVSLVTGASRGIGAATAKALAALKMGPVAVNYATRSADADTVVAAIHAVGGEAAAFRADVSKPDEVGPMYEAIRTQLGTSPLVVVNNAGVTRDTFFMRMTADQWRTVMAIKVDGFFNITQPVMRDMVRAKWGRVINIASIVALGAGEGQVNYAAANAALIAAARALGFEMGSKGITANSICPGFVETEMTGALKPDQRAAYLGLTTSGQPITPERIAAEVVRLVNGNDNATNVIVDDGLLAAVEAKAKAG